MKAAFILALLLATSFGLQAQSFDNPVGYLNYINREAPAIKQAVQNWRLRFSS